MANVVLTTSLTPPPGGGGGEIEAPASSGSGLQAVPAWTAVNDAAVTGDVIEIDVQTEPSATGYSLVAYEVAIGTTSATNIERVILGSWTNVKRYVRGGQNQLNRVWIRGVYLLNNGIKLASPTAAPTLGQTITGGTSVATADVRAYNSGSKVVTIENIVGQFTLGETVTYGVGQSATLADMSAREDRAMDPTTDLGLRVEVKGQWSSPIDVTTTTGTASITFEPSQTSLVLGEGVYIRARVNGSGYLRPEHELVWRWSVSKTGESGNLQFMPEQFSDNFSIARNEGSTAGIWCYCPQTLGDCDIDLLVRDRDGTIATGTLTVNVVSKEATFPEAQRWVVSTSGNFTGAPATSNQYTSYDALLTALPSATPAWIVFRDDESFTHDTRIDGKDIPLFMVSNFGSGTNRPNIRSARDVFNPGTGDRAIYQNITIGGDYSPADPINTAKSGEFGAGIDGRTLYLTMNGIEILSASIAIRSTGQTGAKQVWFDMAVRNWSNFGALDGDAVSTAAHGLAILQAQGAVRRSDGVGAPAGQPLFADHGCFRRNGDTPYDLCFSKTAAYTANNWGDLDTIQNAFRFRSGGIAAHGMTTISEMYSEGSQFAFIQTTPNRHPAPIDNIYKRAIHCSSAHPPNLLEIAHAPITVENVILIQPNAPAEEGLRRSIKTSSFSRAYGVRDLENQPVVINGVSVINLLSDANNTGDRDHVVFLNDPDWPHNNVTITNTLDHAPRHITNGGGVDAGPLESTVRYSPFYQARVTWDEVNSVIVTDTSYASPDECSATFRPQSGSSAYQTATNPPIDDFEGDIRPLTGASKGAREPV